MIKSFLKALLNWSILISGLTSPIKAHAGLLLGHILNMNLLWQHADMIDKLNSGKRFNTTNGSVFINMKHKLL